MTRQAKLLAGLGAVLVLVLYWLFLYKPQNEELTRVRDEIAAVEAEQAAARQTLERLRDVRARAPEIEARMVAAESVVPASTALPAALRQFQVAADDAGATLVTVAPGRPTAVAGDTSGLAELSLSMQVQGTYFQLVDVLRRLEDPLISPRGVVWDLMDVAVEEYPTLTMTLGGRMFAMLPELVAAPEGEAAAATDGGGEGAEAADAAEETGTEEATDDAPSGAADEGSADPAGEDAEA